MFSLPAFARLSSCDFSLRQDDPSAFNYTESFISYIVKLFDEGLITTPDLWSFVENLQYQYSLSNPLIKKTQIRIDYFYQSETFQAYIDSRQVDKRKVLTWAREFLNERQKIQTKKEETVKDTKSIFDKMVFQPAQVTGHTVEILDTLVTQAMWAKVMRENLDVQIANHAVVGVSWWEAIEFANKLSIQQGLKPVYNIGPQGTVTINAPGEDIYQTEGFRLPLWEEIHHLDHKMSQVIGEENHDRKQALGWEKHLPVYELAPQIIDGYEFYDIDVGLNEWTGDTKAEYGNGDPAERYIIIKSEKMKTIQLVWHKRKNADQKDAGVSFRLARSLKN